MMNKEAGSNLVFFLVGAAVGAAVALLYAPQEGAETRRLIGEKASDVKDKATEFGHTAKEKLDMVSSKAQELLHRGQQTAQEAVDNVSENAHAAMESRS
jgi:gas vesicle protein